MYQRLADACVVPATWYIIHDTCLYIMPTDVGMEFTPRGLAGRPDDGHFSCTIDETIMPFAQSYLEGIPNNQDVPRTQRRRVQGIWRDMMGKDRKCIGGRKGGSIHFWILCLTKAAIEDIERNCQSGVLAASFRQLCSAASVKVRLKNVTFSGTVAKKGYSSVLDAFGR